MSYLHKQVKNWDPDKKQGHIFHKKEKIQVTATPHTLSFKNAGPLIVRFRETDIVKEGDKLLINNATVYKATPKQPKLVS